MSWVRFRLLWFILLAFAIANRGEGQGTEHSVTAFELGCSIRRWSEEDGLPDARLFDLVQAPDRSIWVASAGGIHRFDGVRFSPVPLPPEVEISKDEVFWDLMVDRHGKVWAATENFVFRFPSPSEPAVRIGDGVAPGNKHLLERADGSIWLFTASPPTLRVSRFTGSGFEDVSSVPADRFPIDLHEDPDGVVWIALNDSELFRMDDRGPVPADLQGAVLPGGFVHRRDGRAHLIGRTAMHELGKPEALALPNHGPADGPTHILSGVEDDRGIFWFGTWGEGIWTRLPDGRVARVSSARTRLPKRCDRLMRDSEGRIWAATESGLLQFRRGEFLSWPATGLDRSIPATSVAEDPHGGFWFLADFLAFHQQPGGFARLQPSESARFFTGLSPAPDGGAWMVANRLLVMRAKPGTMEMVHVFTQWDPVSDLIATQEDGIWFRCNQRLLRLDGPAIQPVAHPETGQALTVSAVVAAPDGGVLVSPESGGLWHFRGGNWTSLLGGDDAKRSLLLLAPADGGRVWLSDDGVTVSLLEDQTVRPIHSDPAVEIVGMAGDLKGGLWIQSRNNGLSWLPANVVAQWKSGDAAGISPVRFGRDQGLPSLSSNGGPRSLIRDSSGRIWAATQRGFAAIQPADWQANRDRSLPPVPEFREILVDGQPAAPGPDGVHLPAGVQSLQMELFALTLDDPDHTRYRYRLEGFDRDWSEATGPVEALYRNLGPGDYRFRFSAANGFGVWSEEAPALRVQVAPYWWQRRSIQAAGILALLGIAGGGVLWRIRGLRRRGAMLSDFSRRLIATQEEERKRIAHELHDSLGQDLLVIKSRLDIGNFEPAALSGSVADAIQQVKQMSRTLRPALIDRVGLRAALASKVEEVSEATRLPIEADWGEIDGLLDDEASLSIYRLVQEALNNIVAHSDASEARLSAHASRGLLELRIEDDGRGFTPEKLPPSKAGGLGLRGMAERVNHLGGRFHCQSAPGQGTVLRIQIPLRRP